MMKIRKRVKIGVPAQETNTGGINPKKLSKASLSLLQDDQDDDDDHTEGPLGILKKRRGGEIAEIASVEQEPTSYDDIFTKRPASRVMNLEDMDDEEDELMSRTTRDDENVGFKHNKIEPQNPTSQRKKVTEKIYVSLLDDDDKQEILETIKKNGGPARANDPPSDPEIDMLDEERLPLSKREALLQQQRRKQTIEQALKMHDEESSEAWESQLLSKGAGQQQSHRLNTASFPKLHPNEPEESSTGPSKLTQALDSINARKLQLTKQLNILTSQKTSLQSQQETLIHQFYLLQQQIGEPTLQNLTGSD